MCGSKCYIRIILGMWRKEWANVNDCLCALVVGLNPTEVIHYYIFIQIVGAQLACEKIDCLALAHTDTILLVSHICYYIVSFHI